MRKMHKLFSLLASLALAGAVSPVLADSATPAAPTVTVNGLVDAYYAYNFTYPASFSTGAGYFYNNVANSFTLGLAEAKFTATQGQGSGHLVLAYGQESSLGLLTGLGNTGVDVLQAYVTYSPSQWNFSAGRFVTWMGYEVIESSSNWNYSHSLLFGELPFWHTGVSAQFAPDSTFNVTLYDTDTTWNTQTSSTWGKTWGLQVAINPNSMWTITLNGILTPIGGVGTQSNMTGEGIVVYKPTSMWSFALDAQYGTNSIPSGATGPAPSLFGVALYARDQFQSDWAVALRGEYLSDGNNDYAAPGGGVLYGNAAPAGKAFSAMEITGTLEHNLTTNLVGRAEVRGDFANSSSAATNASNVFTDGTANGSSSNITGTVSLAMTF